MNADAANVIAGQLELINNREPPISLIRSWCAELADAIGDVDADRLRQAFRDHRADLQAVRAATGRWPGPPTPEAVVAAYRALEPQREEPESCGECNGGLRDALDDFGYNVATPCSCPMGRVWAGRMA